MLMNFSRNIFPEKALAKGQSKKAWNSPETCWNRCRKSLKLTFFKYLKLI